MFAQIIIEVLIGRRSVHQVSRWTTTECFGALAKRVELTRALSAPVDASGHDVVVRRVRTYRARTGAVEVAAVVEAPSRIHAVAMRLESSGHKWLITALEVG
ncbi:hypothetical protein GCM10027344_25490 [Spelaeicoccus albus]